MTNFPLGSIRLKDFPDYSIDRDSNVFSLRRSNLKQLKQSKGSNGYLQVGLVSDQGKSSRTVHRLLLSTWAPVEGWENLQINHKDGNKLNNKFSNLEWVTCSRNAKHAFEISLRNNKGDQNPCCRTSTVQVHAICRMVKEGFNTASIVKSLNVSRSIVNNIKHHGTWKSISSLYISK